MNSRLDMQAIATALGITKRTAERNASKEQWPFEEVSVKGGKKRFYELSSLPKSAATQIQNYYLTSKVVEVKKQLPSVEVAPINTASLTDHQRDVMLARENLIAFVKEYAGGVVKALDYINQYYADGLLNAHLTWSLEHAWDKPREPLTITRSTFNNWLADKKSRGVAAPLKPQKDMEVKPWHAKAIALKQRPQGSLMRWIHEELAEEFPYVTYDMLTRFFREKFSTSDAIKGRHTGSSLKSHQKYNTRAKVLDPWGELHMDGWNTHFTAPHPITGQYVTYEIWHAHDICTKYTPPVSVGLTENFEVIAKCIENAIRFGGIPRIIQTDSTKIIKNSARMKTDPHTALSERFGFTFVHPQEVGNSQANGTPENFNTTLDRAARELATYQAKSMDSLTLKRVKKITAKMVKAQQSGDMDEYHVLKAEAEKAGKGIVFTSWQDAVAWINKTIDKKNNIPHRALPKIKDETTGKLRHQTPAESLKSYIDAGWEPVRVPDDVITSAFRTHVKCKVTRQVVSPYGGMRYEHEALEHFNNKVVVVAYDSMNFDEVTVKDLDGSLICIATLMRDVARKQTFQEFTEEKRALAQIKLRQTQIAEIEQRTPSLSADIIEGNFKRDDGLIDVEFEMPALPEQEQVFVHEMPEVVQEKTWSETLMWLHGEEEKPNNEDLAVGSAN